MKNEEKIMFGDKVQELNFVERLNLYCKNFFYTLTLFIYKLIPQDNFKLAEVYEKLFKIYFNFKSYKKAAVSFEKLLECKQLEDIEKKLLVLICQIYYNLNDYDKVIEFAEKILILEDINLYEEERFSILGYLSLAYSYKNEFDMALNYANELLNDSKETFKSILLLAHIYLQKKEYNLALSYLYKALELRTKDPYVIKLLFTHFQLIFMEMEKTELAKFVKEIRLFLKRSQGKYVPSARSLFNMVLRNRYLGFKTRQSVFFDIAIEYLDIIVERKFTQKELVKSGINNYEINLFFVELYCEKGEIDKSISYLNQLLNMQLDKGLIRTFLSYLPFLYYKKKDYQLSIKEANAFLKKYPNESCVYHYLSLNYLALNDLENALTTIEKAISIDSISPEYYHHLGKILLVKGEIKKAQENFDISIKMLLMENL